MNALSRELRGRIALLCPDWNPDELSGFLYLEGGYSNDNYRFDHRGARFVLRVPRRRRPFVDRALEKRLYVEAPAVGMPELVALDTGSGDMITRWVAGVLLADRHPTGPELVEYLGRLHAAMPAVERTYDPLAQARDHLRRAAPPRWVVELAAGLDWAPRQVAACHNDLNPWNVICAPDGRWITLDWEWAGRNDPLFDLVTLHQCSGMDEALHDLGERYLGSVPAPARLSACLTVFWLRETAWAMAEIEAGDGRAEVVAQRDLGLSKLHDLRP